jgi:hypothetical protein
MTFEIIMSLLTLGAVVSFYLNNKKAVDETRENIEDIFRTKES